MDPGPQWRKLKNIANNSEYSLSVRLSDGFEFKKTREKQLKLVNDFKL